MTPAVFVAKCDIGRGLFAAGPISAGAEILTLSGPLLTLRQVRAKGALAANALQVGIDRYLDLAEPGRLINHSCAPNVGIKDDVRLVALADIAAETELRFDYSTTIGDGWTMPCRCGAVHCRGLISAYHLLPAELRLRYALLGLVQRFLLEAWEA